MAEQEFLTRRQLREMERRGGTPSLAGDPAPDTATRADAPIQTAPAPAPVVPDATPEVPHFASRRELRAWKHTHGDEAAEAAVTGLPTERLDVLPTPHAHRAPVFPSDVAPAALPRPAQTPSTAPVAVVAEPLPDGAPSAGSAGGVFALLADEDESPRPANPGDRHGLAPRPAPIVPEASAPEAPAPSPVAALAEPERSAAAPISVPGGEGQAAFPDPVHAVHQDPRAALWTSAVTVPGEEDTNGTSGVIVLPSMPSNLDVTSPLDETGEVMLTGTISLPPVVAATGVIPTGFSESDEIDDAGYAIGSSNRPVAVSTVVSEATAERVLPQTRSSRRLTIVLSIVAGVLVVTAAGMLIYYFVLGAK